MRKMKHTCKTTNSYFGIGSLNAEKMKLNRFSFMRLYEIFIFWLKCYGCPNALYIIRTGWFKNFSA